MALVVDISGDRLAKIRSCPLCLLCGSAEEAAVLATQLGIGETKWRTDSIIKEGHYYTFYTGTFGKEEKKLDYYLASSTPARRSFAVQTTLLFHILRPQYALLVGTCSGLKTIGQPLVPGDVLFGDTAVIYREDAWEVLASDAMVQPKNGTSCSMKSFIDSSEETGLLYGRCLSPGPISATVDAISSSPPRVDQCSALFPYCIDAEAGYFLEICQLTQVSALGVVKEVTHLADIAGSRRGTFPKKGFKLSARALKGLIKYYSPTLTQQIRERNSAAASSSLNQSRQLSESDPGVSLCRGYYANFVKVVLDAYRDGHPVTLKSSPTAKLDGVRGLKIVMPPGLQARFYTEAGIFKHVLKEFCLQEVSIGPGRGKSLSYVAGYMIDFPSTINSLVKTPDSSLQVEKFQRTLQSEPYFANGPTASIALICTWKEFLDWLNEVDPTYEHAAEQPPHLQPTPPGNIMDGAGMLWSKSRQGLPSTSLYVALIFAVCILSLGLWLSKWWYQNARKIW